MSSGPATFLTAGGGQLARNIAHFGRLLRRAGLPVGPGAIIDAVHTAEAVGVARGPDFYWALHTVFVKRREHHEIFDQAFGAYWRDPSALNQALMLLLPRSKAAPREPQARRRLAEAFTPPKQIDAEPHEREVELEATLTASEREALKDKDFEQMSAAELEEARAAIARMRFERLAVPTRRFRADRRGRVDMRATLRATLRGGGRDILLRRRRPKTRVPPLVLLCDISGSMGRYSRMLLRFMHAVTNDRDRVHSFVFGTRLTNVTRALTRRDVDEAFDQLTADVKDWEGGTRIGQTLQRFNREWSRRVLGQGAVVVLITDGLEREDPELLEREMERLRLSCRRLVWLNPLLRYDAFEPRVAGVKAMLPHVHAFLPVHDLRSLEQLADALREGFRR